MQQLKVSVIIPVYNSQEYLVQTVESLVKQDFDAYEIILVDDGSTDGSPELCDELAARYPVVRAHHQANAGRCAARNFGISVANGEYVTFADNDDLCLEGFLRDNYELARQSAADCVKFGRRQDVIGLDNAVISSSVKSPSKKIVLHGKEIFTHYDFLRESADGVWAGLYRRLFLAQNKIAFDETMRHGGEDVVFNLAVYRHAEAIALNPGVYYVWLQRVSHSESKTSVDYDMIDKRLRAEVDLMIEKGIDKGLPSVFASRCSEIMREGLSSCLRGSRGSASSKPSNELSALRDSLGYALPYLDKACLSASDKIMLTLLMSGKFDALRALVVGGYLMKYPKAIRSYI